MSRLKYIILLATLLFILLTACSSVHNGQHVITTHPLNLRPCPEATSDCAPIKTLSIGTKLLVLEEKRPWLRVKVIEDNSVGWVHGKYTKSDSIVLRALEKLKLYYERVEYNIALQSLLIAIDPTSNITIPNEYFSIFAKIMLSFIFLWIFGFTYFELERETSINVNQISGLFLVIWLMSVIFLFILPESDFILAPFICIGSMLLSGSGFLIVRSLASIESIIIISLVFFCGLMLLIVVGIVTGELIAVKIGWVILHLLGLIGVARNIEYWANGNGYELVWLLTIILSMFCTLIDPSYFSRIQPTTAHPFKCMFQFSAVGLKFSYLLGLIIGGVSLLIVRPYDDEEEYVIKSVFGIICAIHVLVLMLGLIYGGIIQLKIISTN